jgi:hypothetical protein
MSKTYNNRKRNAQSSPLSEEEADELDENEKKSKIR